MRRPERVARSKNAEKFKATVKGFEIEPGARKPATCKPIFGFVKSKEIGFKFGRAGNTNTPPFNG